MKRTEANEWWATMRNAVSGPTPAFVRLPVKRKAVQRAKNELRERELRHDRPRHVKRAKARLEKRVAAEAKRPKKVVEW